MPYSSSAISNLEFLLAIILSLFYSKNDQTTNYGVNFGSTEGPWTKFEDRCFSMSLTVLDWISYHLY